MHQDVNIITYPKLLNPKIVKRVKENLILLETEEKIFADKKKIELLNYEENEQVLYKDKK